MAAWDDSADLVIVGSGGGALCAALVAASQGKQALVLEKTDKVGGSTAMSGGVLWVPANSLMARAGVADSLARARTYLDAVVGEAGPASSPERRSAYLTTGPVMVEFLEHQGIRFNYCEGWSDYYDDYPGGEPRGRSLQCELFDSNTLGDWKPRLRSGPAPAMPLAYPETIQLGLVLRTRKGLRALALLMWRGLRQALRGTALVNAGMALQGRMLDAVLKAGVPVWTGAAVEALVEEEGRVVGVVVRKDGKPLRIQARQGVLLNSGGFAHNGEMRKQYQPQPASADWTFANPGDTGEVIRQAMALGAATDLLDQSWWVPASVGPDGQPLMHVMDLPKPHCIVVDSQGQRFVDESVSYMEFGQTLYRHGAVPAWAILDSRHRSRYLWYMTPPGFTPKAWVAGGYMKKATTLADLARQCDLDPHNLEATVARFNGFARAGRDEDFQRGARVYGGHYADPSNRPNSGLGTIERGPFYAVAIYPGDVGTAGGLLTDEHARVLRQDGSAIAGLYATGNCTASVMGRTYPAAGASIGASFVFGYVAAHHALTHQP